MTLRRYDANGRLLEDAEPDGLAYFVNFADYRAEAERLRQALPTAGSVTLTRKSFDEVKEIVHQRDAAADALLLVYKFEEAVRTGGDMPENYSGPWAMRDQIVAALRAAGRLP